MVLAAHLREVSFNVKAFSIFNTRVSSVIDADIFARPGPFNASLQALVRRHAGSNEVYFDTRDYITFDELVSVLAMNATRWPWAFRIGICRDVDVDKINRCVATAYMIAFSWKACARIIKGVEDSRRQNFDWIVVSRIDLEWTWNHPPVAFLDRDYIWPLGYISVGVPDQHLVFSRKHLAHMSSFWDSLSCPTTGYVRQLHPYYRIDKN